MKRLPLQSLLLAICASAAFAGDNGTICPPGYYSKPRGDDQVPTCAIGSDSANQPKVHSYKLQWGTNAVTVTARQGDASPFSVLKDHSESECEFSDGVRKTQFLIRDDAGLTGMVSPISDDGDGVKTLVRFSMSTQQKGKHLVLSTRCSVDEQSTQTMTITRVVTIRAGEDQTISLPDGSKLIARVTAP